MPRTTTGRRTVLTGLITALAVLAFGGPAYAVPTATVTITNGPGGPPVLPPLLNQTTSRTANSISFSVAAATAGDYVECATDGGAPTVCAPATANGPYVYSATGTPYDLGSHEVAITPYDAGAVAGPTKYYTWRVEPVVYGPHILGHNNVTDNLRAYFPLDDPVSANQDVLDAGPNAVRRPLLQLRAAQAAGADGV